MFSELNFKIMIKAAGVVGIVWIIMVLAIIAIGG
jgi:hypothetical protein